MLSDNVRKDIIIALQKKRRRIGKLPSRPHKWYPTKVPNPDSWFGVFTPEGAWDLVQQELENGVEAKLLILDKPPGAKSYTFTVSLPGCAEDLYVKIEFLNGWVIGRSFHQ